MPARHSTTTAARRPPWRRRRRRLAERGTGHEVRLPAERRRAGRTGPTWPAERRSAGRLRPGREPRRRRHHAAHRRPGRRPRRAGARRQRRPARLPHRGRAARPARTPLERFFAGEHHIEERMLLDGRPSRRGRVERPVALNEAVLEKTPLGPHRAPRRRASTASSSPPTRPTGSSWPRPRARPPTPSRPGARSWPPTHRALLLTPVSPHMLFDRTWCSTPRPRCASTVVGHRPAELSVDGRSSASSPRATHARARRRPSRRGW